MNLGIGSASWLEMIWLIAGGCGWLYTFANYRAARATLRAVIDVGWNGVRITFARGCVRREAERLILLTLIVLLGVRAAILPPRDAGQVIDVGALFVALGAIFVISFVALGSIQDSQERAYIAHALDAEQRRAAYDDVTAAAVEADLALLSTSEGDSL